MKINTIVFDQPPGTKASNAPRGGDGDFQVAYAHILDDSSAPLARDVATAQPSRGQDSSPHRDDAAHTVRVGETLYGIVRARLATMGVQANAKASMLGVKQLAQANSIHNPDRIYVGQKLDLSALDSSFGHQVAPQTSNIDRPATAASGINQPQQWHWKEPEPESGAQITAEVAALPPTIDTLPLAIDTLPPTIPRNEIAAPVDAGTRTPLAMRQVALYEQNGSIAPAKPAEVALALPDIVYK
ncbi:MAG: LysM domain-containing protein, partial [Burkholderiaceae bacterium]